ncbi:MAG: hut operon positive regulator HutP [Clostridia bacterium]|nr:hut operon positive regulator HutP [Clostridia bacterium]
MAGSSKQAAKAAIRLAISDSREEESRLKKELLQEGVKGAAVDFGGEYLQSAGKVVERAIIAAKREGVIKDTHADEGAVAGAAREALSQIMPKALGFNMGGKIGIARINDHISVAVFFGIGLVHLDEVAIGLGHRAVP